MGATLSQPYIPMLPRSIKSKSKRPRYLFRLPIRWKKKRTLPEIHAPLPNPGHHDHREESRESKLYDGSSAEGEESSPSHQSLPITSANDKPLPKLPLEAVFPAAQLPNQQAQLNFSSDRPAKVMQSINASVEDINQEDDNEDVSDSDSDFSPEIERPHTPPPWDTSLSGYGSVLEISRPFRARRVFEHPLVEGHFLGSYKGDDLIGGGGRGPIAAEEKRRVWRVWESTNEKGKGEGEGKGEERGKGKRKYNGVDDEWKEVGIKSERQQKAIEGRERERGKKRTKTRRMSEWKKWKPLPRYPACTGVAQRATSSTWADTAATGDSDSAWREVFVEQAEDQEYHGGDEEEKEDDEDEDLEKAIKRFLEIKIPVDLSSLRRLRISLAGTAGEHTTTGESGTGETAGGKAEKEHLDGEQGQLSPVDSLMFTDTDIEGFEFLIEEEDEGGGTWDSGTVVGVTSGRVEGKGGACKMDGLIGGFAGGDASRAEVSEEDSDHNLTVRTAFSVTQRLSRWKERV
ncbi:hypothetical protein NEUTE1DRAFT_46663 [Neurospora tetrasperma FGSC 2508]|uniref:Uncharacterized protein n=1 Tax=Neurospora tetrasperma (strain FGSC 2508 / ATCC MYA-4615 / P0657) TaxID=510951 RepID=F8MS41_NEUT8|nr:uncharacterized protein NEUTE1DRAFT_46663 [Neurospora tetrasperma FGSC 2508]EGO55835.1 hypothetical protein NEUTE1DRAFT_46663 [Neurospora tetrasperma FGSC 2508]EGZ68908.1 hypothetical protein NEUTE2DRAFT_131316 [Neurospora tetrasperma FGSC 2509]